LAVDASVRGEISTRRIRHGSCDVALVVIGIRRLVRTWLCVAIAASVIACESLYPASVEGLDEPESMTVYALAPDEAVGTDDLAERVQGIPARRKVVVEDQTIWCPSSRSR
jgi:hypothetical protein